LYLISAAAKKSLKMLYGTKFSLTETAVKILDLFLFHFNELIITRFCFTRQSKAASHYSVCHSVDSLHLQLYINISRETL